jgi:uncharacterized membrane protein YeaQ/YmgE (transglycosylase-associated protein family)
VTILLLLTLLGGLAAWLTCLVSEKTKPGPVFASAITSLIVALVAVWLKPELGDQLRKNISLIFFGGSFVGMSATTIIKNKAVVFIAGCLFAALFLSTTHLFIGYGGGLGFKASLSVLIVIGVLNFYPRLKNAFFFRSRPH